MAFKMKGAPQHDLSSKHGTNANFKKTGAPLMKGIGKLAGNFIKGKGAMGILNPVGAIANRMGAFGKNNNQQAQAAQAAPAPDAPAQPAGPAPAAAAPVAPEEAAAPTMMKKGLKNGAPMKDLSGDGKITQKDVLIGKGVIKKPKAGATMKKKAGAPMDEDAKRDKAEWDAKQAKKAAKKKKEADFKKLGDKNLKYHQDQAKARGVSWPEYQRKLKKRTRGY